MTYHQGVQIVEYLGTLVWLWEFTLGVIGAAGVIYVILFPIWGLFRYHG